MYPKSLQSIQKQVKTPMLIVNRFQTGGNTTVSSVYLFFGSSVLESPVGEGPHFFKLFFLSVQHLAQVHNHLREDTSHKKLV